MGYSVEGWEPGASFRISSVKEGLLLHSGTFPERMDGGELIKTILPGLISWEFLSDDPRAIEAKSLHLQRLFDLRTAPAKTDIVELCCALNLPFTGDELELFIDQYAYSCSGNVFDRENPLDRLDRALPGHLLSPQDIKALHALKYAILRYIRSDMVKPLLLNEAETRLVFRLLLYSGSTMASDTNGEPELSIRLSDALHRLVRKRQHAASLFFSDPSPSPPNHSRLQPIDRAAYLAKLTPLLAHFQFSDTFIEDYTAGYGLPPQPVDVLSRLIKLDLSADKLGRIRRGELLMPRNVWLLRIYYRFWSTRLHHAAPGGPGADRLALFVRQADPALAEAAFSGLGPAHLFDYLVMLAVYYGVDYFDFARLLIRPD